MKITIIFLVIVASIASCYGEPCFAPLANVNSHDPTDWRDLKSRVPSAEQLKAPGVKQQETMTRFYGKTRSCGCLAIHLAQ